MHTEHEWLREAAKLRALSLLFVPPTEAVKNELGSLANDINAFDSGFGARLWALAEDIGDVHSIRYHDALGPTGAVRDCESDYEVNPLGGKGPLIADVAGFYLAFKYEDRTFDGLGFDHIANECGFLSWLSFRVAFAQHESDAEAASVCSDAMEKFLRDHVSKWARTFFTRVRDNSGDSWFVRAVDLCEESLSALTKLDPAAPDLRKRSLPQADEGEIECALPADA